MAVVKRADKLTELTTADRILYTDFCNNFDVHPERHDLIRKLDSSSVKQALKNLIMTNRKERLFNPNFGSDIQQLLFELATPATAALIKNFIETTINNFEPRVEIVDLVVNPDVDRNTYSVSLTFGLHTVAEPLLLEFILDRVR